ncbi:MAG: site-2 protease family protein [Planctomycetes bacterium]|nr:site-2 protease family protein [Planctomycetota bacterium]
MTFICYPLFEKHPIANPAKAFVVGIRQAYRATVATAQTIRHMLFTRNVGLSNVSGPLGIAHKGSEVAQGGLIALCWFLGLISANLAVINFLPLPIVDGGLFLFLILEKIRGEPVSIKTQVATQLLGIALIATVFILVTYQDILRFFS